MFFYVYFSIIKHKRIIMHLCIFQQKKTNKGYSKPTTQAARSQQPAANRGKNTKSPVKSEKTVKQLLGELYSDKEYLEKLMADQGKKYRRLYIVFALSTYLKTKTKVQVTHFEKCQKASWLCGKKS